MIHTKLNNEEPVAFSPVATIKYDPAKLIYKTTKTKVNDDAVIKNSLLTYLSKLYELSGKPDKKDEITKMITETPSDTKVEDYVETDSALRYLTELKKYIWQSGVLGNLYKSMLETQIAIVSNIVGYSAEAATPEAETSDSTGTAEQGTKGGKKTRRNKQTHLKRTFREH